MHTTKLRLTAIQIVSLKENHPALFDALFTFKSVGKPLGVLFPSIDPSLAYSIKNALQVILESEKPEDKTLPLID